MDIIISLFKRLYRSVFYNNHKNIFIWNDNFSKINALFLSLIDQNQLMLLKANPPKEFPPENLTWLGRFTKLGSNHEEITDNLIQIFSRAFSHIRLYHACCPKSLQSYYKKGFIPLNPEEVEKDFKQIFSPHTSEEEIQYAIQRVRNSNDQLIKNNYLEIRKKTYFSINKEYIDNDCGEFMISSEYLGYFVAGLNGIDSNKKQNILLQGMIPTVFVVDIPIKRIDKNNLSSVIGHTACKWMWIFKKEEEDYARINGSVYLPYVKPEYIFDHYHLEKIVDSVSDIKSLNILETYCDKCRSIKSFLISSRLL